MNRDEELPAHPTRDAADPPSGDAVTRLPDPLSIAEIGPYVILRAIGRGGMGTVYLARDTRLERQVAIKVLSAPGTADAPAIARIMREARAAAQLHHPGIAAVHDVIAVDNCAGIVMEVVGGETLSRYLQRHQVTPIDAARMGVQLADALAHAHEAGVVHCDLKPGNIHVLPDGRLKILDFGLALRRAASGDGALKTESMPSPGAGTPAYMSPEQMVGRPLDSRTDIYSLGLVLFEIATGSRPYAGVDPMQRASAILNDPPLDPAAGLVPAPLAAVIRKAMAPSADQRYQSARELADALRTALTMMTAGSTETVGASPASLPPRGIRHWEWLAAVVVVLIASAAAAPTILRRGFSRATAAGPPVVAVLPFDAAGADASLAAGIADVLTTDLASQPGLVVVARQSTLTYAGDKRNLQKAAKELGATHLVTGMLQQSGGELRVTATMVGPDLQQVRWSGHFDRPAAEVFALQQDIARDVIRYFDAIAGDQKRAPLPVHAADRQAFEDYAQGRTFLDRFDVPGNLDRALTLFRSAAARDPAFALAHAAIGETLRMKFEETKDRQLLTDAQAATLEALRLEPNQPMVRYALAVIYRDTGRRAEAVDELRKAIALQPSGDELHRALGQTLADMGRNEEAVAEVQLAVRLRPGFWRNYRSLGLLYYDMGRYADSIRELTRVTELQPDSAPGFQMLGTVYHATGSLTLALDNYRRANAIRASPTAWSNIGTIYYARKEYGEAVAAYRQSLSLQPAEPATYRNLGDALMRLRQTAEARQAYMTAIERARQALEVNPRDGRSLALEALCQAKLGKGDEARTLIDRAIGMSPASGSVRYQQAVIATIAGKPDDALAALARALELGYSKAQAREDDDLTPLRDRPAFQRLVADPR